MDSPGVVRQAFSHNQDPQRKSASLLLGPNRAYILPVSWPIQPGEVLVRHIAGG
jgi:hypothetical protein